jgi:uncharacterized RDD family membrane protein YckC
MRCPKCHYISFDSGDRCRNCGYDFSFTAETHELDLPTQKQDEPIGPMADLELSAVGRSSSAGDGSVSRRGAGEKGAAAASGVSADLPLFTDRLVPDAAPLVNAAATPRAPLAVRRSTPPLVRHKPRGPEPEEEEAVLDLGFPGVDAAGAQTVSPDLSSDSGHPAAAPFGRRLGAALIDGGILAAIDVAILYFTLELCGLPRTEIARLPAVPFGAFVLLLNGGYFVAFTAAGGQTIGKMAAGIRVVPAINAQTAGERVPFGFAVLRAAAYLVSVVPAGLGLIPAIVGAEHRALHDRLADTRVVKA